MHRSSFKLVPNAGAGLSSGNTVGMEVVAKDDRDITPAQVAAAKAFIASRYPNTPVFWSWRGQSRSPGSQRGNDHRQRDPT